MINPKPFDSDELYDNCSSDPKQVTCICGKVAFSIFNGGVRKAVSVHAMIVISMSGAVLLEDQMSPNAMVVLVQRHPSS